MPGFRLSVQHWLGHYWIIIQFHNKYNILQEKSQVFQQFTGEECIEQLILLQGNDPKNMPPYLTQLNCYYSIVLPVECCCNASKGRL